MTEQENINNEVQMKLALQDAKFNQFMQSVERNFSEMRERDKIRAEEMQDFKNEMRQQNQMRATEISEIRNDIREINKTTDAKISKIESKIDSMGNHIQILSLTAMGGIIAAGVGIAAMIWSVGNK